MDQLMQPWSEDFSGFDLEEILRSQSENRAWGKELRRRTNALVDSRLAKHITQADYDNDRKLFHQDAEEFRRRATILDAQIVRHTVRSLRPGN
jgi:hypothetical protein